MTNLSILILLVLSGLLIFAHQAQGCKSPYRKVELGNTNSAIFISLHYTQDFWSIVSFLFLHLSDFWCFLTFSINYLFSSTPFCFVSMDSFVSHFHFLDEPPRTVFDPKRNKNKLQSSFLEDCRVYLSKWAKSIMRDEFVIYRDGYTNFALFNSSGYLEYYSIWGTRYCYEIPCDSHSYLRKVYSTEMFSSQVNYNNCMSFHSYLWTKADEYLHPSYNGYYEGNLGKFCYSNDWVQQFPVKVETPDDLKSFKIRSNVFYVKTKNGAYFKSPSYHDYLRFMRKRTMFIDDGSEDSDYLYDYWD